MCGGGWARASVDKVLAAARQVYPILAARVERADSARAGAYTPSSCVGRTLGNPDPVGRVI